MAAVLCPRTQAEDIGPHDRGWAGVESKVWEAQCPRPGSVDNGQNNHSLIYIISTACIVVPHAPTAGSSETNFFYSSFLLFQIKHVAKTKAIAKWVKTPIFKMADPKIPILLKYLIMW